MKIPYSTDWFINKARALHHDVYDYSQTKYVKNMFPVTIICKHHGVFEQSPHNHLKGKGCKFCANNTNITIDEFIKRAKSVHGNTYDYSLVKYKNNRTLINIVCKVHGVFNTLPTNHLKGVKCESCAIEERAFNQRLPLANFISRSHKAHNNYYSYNKVIFITTKHKVIITCPKHGNFSQIPETHMKGVGCPKCRMSKGELEIIKYLETNNINYEYQKRFHDCKYKRYLVFDFYIPNKNICIEFDGAQHHVAVPFFGGQKALDNTILRDSIKSNYCLANNINLIRIDGVNKISNILNFIQP